MDIYRDAKRRGIYPPLLADPEGLVVLVFIKSDGLKECRFINGHNFFL